MERWRRQIYKKGLVLLSGGLDSSTLACKLVREGLNIEGLFIDYGQSMASTELRAAKYISSWANFNLKVISIRLDKSITSGCLFEITPKIWDTNRVSFFPQRNAFLLIIASMYAQKQDIKDIYIGAIKMPNPFPDTTEEFFIAMQIVLRRSFPDVTILYPFISKNKAQIVALARQIGMPIDATFSCEMAKDHHCMQCPSCLDRYWAIEEDKK